MHDSCRLREALTVALDRVLVPLQARVDHPTIVVVSDDLDRAGARHD